MRDPYFDRFGREKYDDDSVPVCQTGYFVIIVKDDKVLTTYPPKVNVPEFPGGCINTQEDYKNCLFRKLFEETGIEYMLCKSSKTVSQDIKYFADDSAPFGTFCNYHQNFFIYDASTADFDTSREAWKTPENGKAEWIDIKKIISGEKKINYAHWQGFKKLFSID